MHLSVEFHELSDSILISYIKLNFVGFFCFVLFLTLSGENEGWVWDDASTKD